MNAQVINLEPDEGPGGRVLCLYFPVFGTIFVPELSEVRVGISENPPKGELIATIDVSHELYAAIVAKLKADAECVEVFEKECAHSADELKACFWHQFRRP